MEIKKFKIMIIDESHAEFFHIIIKAYGISISSDNKTIFAEMLEETAEINLPECGSHLVEKFEEVI